MCKHFSEHSQLVCVVVFVRRQNHTAGDAEVRIRNNAARSGPAFLQTHIHTHAMFFSQKYTYTHVTHTSSSHSASAVCILSVRLKNACDAWLKNSGYPGAIPVGRMQIIVLGML